MSFIHGVNYGNIFIPEDFFANQDFFEANGVKKQYDKYSLCDLVDNKEQAMRDWLELNIVESDFKEMHDFGIDFLRLPLGYWNVIDMEGNPNAPSCDADRMGNLSTIMPSSASYRPYIDKIFEWTAKYNIWVMLDLHGAPGNQNGDSHAGCHVSNSGYWDTDWNKLWTSKAVVALA